MENVLLSLQSYWNKSSSFTFQHTSHPNLINLTFSNSSTSTSSHDINNSSLISSHSSSTTTYTNTNNSNSMTTSYQTINNSISTTISSHDINSSISKSTSLLISSSSTSSSSITQLIPNFLEIRKIYRNFKPRIRLLNKKHNSKAYVPSLTLTQLERFKPKSFFPKIQKAIKCCYKNSSITIEMLYTKILEFQSRSYKDRMNIFDQQLEYA